MSSIWSRLDHYQPDVPETRRCSSSDLNDTESVDIVFTDTKELMFQLHPNMNTFDYKSSLSSSHFTWAALIHATAAAVSVSMSTRSLSGYQYLASYISISSPITKFINFSVAKATLESLMSACLSVSLLPKTLSLSESFTCIWHLSAIMYIAYQPSYLSAPPPFSLLES